MLYRTDMEGKITMISPAGAKRAGFGSAEEMIGLDLAQTLYADPQERKKFLAILARKGSVNAYPLVLKDRNGHRYHVTASSHYYYDPDGHVLGVEGIIHDVTHLKQAEDALKEANRKLNLLNSITRHDVANQLTVLQGYTQLAMVKNPDPMIADFLQKIDSVTTTIGRQIEFSKTYQELGVHAPGWFSLDDIFARNKAQGYPVFQFMLPELRSLRIRCWRKCLPTFLAIRSCTANGYPGLPSGVNRRVRTC